MTEKTIERVEQESKQVGYKVRVKSKRGSGTNDRDEVQVTGNYETIEEAEEESGRLTSIVQQRMQEARRPDENGEIETEEPEFDNDSFEQGAEATEFGSDTIKGP